MFPGIGGGNGLKRKAKPNEWAPQIRADGAARSYDRSKKFEGLKEAAQFLVDFPAFDAGLVGAFAGDFVTDVGVVHFIQRVFDIFPAHFALQTIQGVGRVVIRVILWIRHVN